MQKKIVFTGGSGRFGQVFKKIQTKEKIYFPKKQQLNIENFELIKRYLNKINPTYLIHAAGLSRPMNIHEKDISKSININIIGTANIVKACKEKNIKLIYFSTNHVYPGIKGNYKEKDPILPINKYAVSKFGGECSVQMYSNSLILRICMTEKPFVHKKAFNDVETNFMYHETLAKNLVKLIDKKGIINVGGEKNTILNFAKKNNKNVVKISAKKIFGKNYPLKQSMKVDLYNKAIK
ncbi:sugar nucleotide-binding protein [Candidatus Pelagibacter bacterium]|nr:sugar nucleotide-binding protein [Candidatus Pelagibacter bacterium]MDA8844764.1 sugar nucleotide-binding protein [Candidatus Pelagibacter bacterium]